MALILSNRPTPYGVVVAAYVKIGAFTGSKDTGVEYSVSTYLSEAARLANATPVLEEIFATNYPADGDLLAGLYADLKTKPGYEAAVDD